MRSDADRAGCFSSGATTSLIFNYLLESMTMMDGIGVVVVKVCHYSGDECLKS